MAEAFFNSHDLVSTALIHNISLSDGDISTCVNFLKGMMISMLSICPLGHFIVSFSLVKYSQGCVKFFSIQKTYHFPNSFSASICDKWICFFCI
jgi:hypothetical protein